MSAGSGRSRREPRQRRSREIVRAILEAGRDLLERDGPGALTTGRIAERAGVSIGSIYRYFADKDAIVAALYDRALRDELASLDGEDRHPLAGLTVREGVERLVDFQIERHRRLLALEGDYYRDHHREFSLARRLGAEAVGEIIGAFLDEHACEIDVGDVEQAAFLLGRGTSAVVRLAVEQEPARLEQSAFRAELVEMLCRYLVARR